MILLEGCLAKIERGKIYAHPQAILYIYIEKTHTQNYIYIHIRTHIYIYIYIPDGFPRLPVDMAPNT